MTEGGKKIVAVKTPSLDQPTSEFPKPQAQPDTPIFGFQAVRSVHTLLSWFLWGIDPFHDQKVGPCFFWIVIPTVHTVDGRNPKQPPGI